MSADVCIVVPTLRRPESLRRALESLTSLTRVDGRIASVVVVDNDPVGSARPVVEALSTETDLPLVYVSLPRPGIATARNAGVAADEAPLVAFLDDDEAASPGWLAALLKVQAGTGADAVFGPIRGRADDAAPWLRPYLEAFFGREGPRESGLLDRAWGCGNSLLVRATALPGPAPFDVAADQTGGEDDALFRGLAARGGRFAWAADAWVDEFAPAHRATLSYALARAFAYGQGPSQDAAARRDWPGVARWMAVGLAQAGVWGALACLMWLARRPARARMLDRAARGAGKLFWMRGFEPHFYGAREVERLDRATA